MSTENKNGMFKASFEQFITGTLFFGSIYFVQLFMLEEREHKLNSEKVLASIEIEHLSKLGVKSMVKCGEIESTLAAQKKRCKEGSRMFFSETDTSISATQNKNKNKTDEDIAQVKAPTDKVKIQADIDKANALSLKLALVMQKEENAKNANNKNLRKWKIVESFCSYGIFAFWTYFVFVHLYKYNYRRTNDVVASKFKEFQNIDDKLCPKGPAFAEAQKNIEKKEKKHELSFKEFTGFYQLLSKAKMKGVVTAEIRGMLFLESLYPEYASLMEANILKASGSSEPD